MKAERVRCVVPFCKRTIKPGDFGEWICARHWAAVDPRAKWLHRRAKRMLRQGRKGWSEEEVFAFADRAWERCKKQAIEKAAGI